MSDNVFEFDKAENSLDNFIGKTILSIKGVDNNILIVECNDGSSFKVECNPSYFPVISVDS